MERKETYKRKERSDLIYGLHPVLEAINADRELNKILIQKGISKDVFRDLKEALAGKDFQLQFVPVEKIIVHMDFTGNNWDSSTLEKVIIAGKTCPVAKTIEDSVQIEFNF